MDGDHSASQLDEALAKAERWYVWVIEYGITHHLMKLAVHTGNYPFGLEVVCEDATRFEGALQGGPYRLVVRNEELSGGPVVVLAADDASFLIRARTFRIVRQRP